jgi:hypothetical protein
MNSVAAAEAPASFLILTIRSVQLISSKRSAIATITCFSAIESGL